MKKKVIFWIVAVVVSLGIMVYQRITGPTYKKDYKIAFNGTDYKFALPRSHGGDSDCPVTLELPEPIEGTLVWRKFPTQDPWNRTPLVREGNQLTTSLPHQPPAGKLEYHLELSASGERIVLGDTENVVIRFKGGVPGWAQIPHILMMVLTVIFSMATILFALADMPVYKKYVGVTIIFLILGGFILGPTVQKFAFGQFWTGWPFGEDLTDNKVLVALIAFAVAWFLRNKTYSRWLAIGASLIMLAVYLIPHSMNGSELNPETGEVVTGTFMALIGKSTIWKHS